MCIALRPKRVGVKSGMFTLLHAGHVAALQYCRERCDHLILLTNTDDRVAAKRGCAPISLQDRLFMLQALSCVDETSWFSQLTEEEWVKVYKDTRLKEEHGEAAELILFHDPVIENSGHVPCQTIADEIIYVPYVPSKAAKTSVSDMFKLIKQYGEVK